LRSSQPPWCGDFEATSGYPIPAQVKPINQGPGTLGVADAAHELRLAPNTVSTLVGRLTAAGLLERARAVPDGRSVRLSVTDQARRRIAGWRDLRAELGAGALEQLPPSWRTARKQG
jgi:DNA-binding MarR family transcriptional regulator